MATEEELLKLKKAELVALAEEAGLDTDGTKAELAVLLATPAPTETGGDTGEPTAETKAEPELVTKAEPELKTTRYAPSSDLGFIQSCFEGQLGRLPTQDELDLWVKKLSTGASRNFVQERINLLDGNTGWKRLESLEAVGKDSTLR